MLVRKASAGILVFALSQQNEPRERFIFRECPRLQPSNLSHFPFVKAPLTSSSDPNNALDLWYVKKVSPQNTIHLTEKPVELATRAMEYSSRPGENVLDLFGGSGSTLIAAEQLNRRAVLMELDPLYTDTIIDRWQRFTGQQAVRADGTPLPKQPPAKPEHLR
jgi:hypothetical protein